MIQKLLKNPAQLPDINQSAWQLAIIQLSGLTSLPVLAVSILLLQNNSLPHAILNLVIGNLILWIIRYGIICMSHKDRKSTMDIARDYFGHTGSYLIAVVLLLATLAWFIAETALASNALSYLIPIKEEGVNRFIQTSVAIGIISTLLCMNGIIVVRWTTMIAFPIILAAFLGVIFATPQQSPIIHHEGFSLSGLTLVLGTSLGISADLPTFFRHSASLRTSIKAITLIQIISLCIGIGGLFVGSSIGPWMGIDGGEQLTAQSGALKFFLLVLIFFSVICANISNVYSASVGWELVAPVFLVGRKEYLILGLGLTMVLILIGNLFSIDTFLNTTDGALINLCLVLIIGYVVHLLSKHRPTSFEQAGYCVAWGVATIVNMLQYFKLMLSNYLPLIVSIAIILLIVCGTHLGKRILIKRQALKA